MDKDTRSAIEHATQRTRRLLEEDFALQLEGTFDVLRAGTVATKAGGHLSPRQVFQRDKLVAAIEHKRAAGMSTAEAVSDYLRDAAFTALNRFVALKMLEARELVQECISQGEQSAGYREFCGLAPAVGLLPDSTGYRLYIETLFDELSTEVKVLFDRRDPASVLWPKRATFEAVLEVLNASDLSSVWHEDETIGWVYQYFNSAEERRAMRDASQMPRNSRELAIRNQFFTPRYVVQFLTENTLGRIWSEMCNWDTSLTSRCQYLVSDPRNRSEKKDPRDIRILDPACGSGHFLLYAFDLLITIYEEAWHSSSATSEATGKSLRDDYPTDESLRRSMPGLILEHNLHGVDIDPRCAQIASLALWMRAQRAFRDSRIARGDRPLIRRANIVLAEPMPGEQDLLREFAARLGEPSLVDHFEELVSALRLAGELGLLLPLETLFAPSTPKGQSLDLFAALQGRIRGALQAFAREAAMRRTVQRLFADDALAGLGLLEMAEKKFDVVLMNPPFGQSTAASAGHKALSDSAGGDLYTAFVSRGVALLRTGGLLGALTPRSFMYQIDFANYRRNRLLADFQLSLIVELGYGELDAASNRTAAYTLSARPRASQRESRPALYANLSNSSDKASALRHRRTDQWLAVAPGDFIDEAACQLLFRMTATLRDQLRSLPRLDPVLGKRHTGKRDGVAHVVNGLQCPMDFRYVRLAAEVPREAIGTRWRRFLKPSDFAPYVGELNCVVNWEAGGQEQKAEYVFKGESPSTYASGETHYPTMGTWFPDVSERGIGASIIPFPSIPGRKGILAVGRDSAEVPADALAGFLNSVLAEGMLGLFTPERHHKPSYMGQIPWLAGARDRSAAHYWRMVDLASAEAPSELSPFFRAPDVVVSQARTLKETAEALTVSWQHAIAEMRGELDAFDAEILQAAGASKDDADLLGEMSQRGAVESWFPTHHTIGDGLTRELAVDLVSYAIGLVFGRWGIDSAPRQRRLDVVTSESDALHHLHTGAQRTGDVLVDDQGHRDDVVSALSDACALIWRNDVPALLDELGDVLAQTPDGLRKWVGGEFFEEHLARYSKSRRKAPTYWQLSTPSASYSVWVNLHTLTSDTLYKVQRDYVAPKLAHEERRLIALRAESGTSPNAGARKVIGTQEALVEELRGFLEELKRVAPLWKPHLDDGVVLNAAPLWRLMTHCKSWQKELISAWGGLVSGQYDWSCMAMHLWPERVVPKCALDPSLAVAHRLLDAFWVEGVDGKWKARSAALKPVEELIRERSSPSAKEALESLLQAPVASGSSSRGRAGRRGVSPAATRRGSP